MPKIECVAMLLAGGEGKRLSHLTKKIAKPAVPFGGKYRIIDFTLSNCCNSGIHTVGILTQYQPMVLNSYIGIGSSWDLDRKNGGVTVLPPYVEQTGGRWYKGTSHAIYQNMAYLDQYDAEYVLVISGDHIYKMNYAEMLNQHKKMNADVSIAVIEIPIEESYRFGMMKVDENDWIVEFQEKPKVTTSNTASMGVYIFNWRKLKAYLIADEEKKETNSDFGQDIIPAMLANHEQLYAYRYKGYWKDVGTIDSLWEAHMDLLATDKPFRLHDPKWRIFTKNPNQPPQYIGSTARINRSLVNEGCMVFGEIDHSVLFYGVDVGEGSVIKDSIIMPQSKIGKNVTIHRAIIGWNTVIEDNARIGNPDESTEITLVGDNQTITE